jgi:hypothetical protein
VLAARRVRLWQERVIAQEVSSLSISRGQRFGAEGDEEGVYQREIETQGKVTIRIVSESTKGFAGQISFEKA